jgi:hypothetical protein
MLIHETDSKSIDKCLSDMYRHPHDVLICFCTILLYILKRHSIYPLPFPHIITVLPIQLNIAPRKRLTSLAALLDPHADMEQYRICLLQRGRIILRTRTQVHSKFLNFFSAIVEHLVD